MNTPDHKITLFGQLVRSYRARAKVTQEALAALTDAVAPLVEQRYPHLRQVEGLTRETINTLEAPYLKHAPRERTVAVLAYALSEALAQAGEDIDPTILDDKLSAATRPSAPILAQIISEEAVMLDAMMMSFSETERKAKYAGIMAMVQTERDERIKAQWERDMRQQSHSDE